MFRNRYTRVLKITVKKAFILISTLRINTISKSVVDNGLQELMVQ
jgi:hypothetical protein